MSPHDTGLQLLENSLATAGALVALILAFGSVSGAHLNPVVSLADRVFGGLTNGALAVYVVAQLVGWRAGGGRGQPHVRPARRSTCPPMSATAVGSGWARSSPPSASSWSCSAWCARGQAAMAPYAVAGYIAAAYWFTSSTSFANPAVTVARTLSDSFAGIRPSSAPGFVLAQVGGGLLAIAVAELLYPEVDGHDVVVPHEPEPGPAR